MSKVRPGKSFGYKILKALALSGMVVIASTNPFFGMRAAGYFQKELKRKKWREFKKAIDNLKKSKRLNVTSNADGTFTLEITQIGKNTVKKYDLDNIKINTDQEWDGGWRVIIFDIPKEKQGARQALLGKLKELEFIMIQKSIWAHPFECREELAVISKAFEVEPYVYSFIAWEFDNDKAHRLKGLFRKKSGIILK